MYYCLSTMLPTMRHQLRHQQAVFAIKKLCSSRIRYCAWEGASYSPGLIFLELFDYEVGLFSAWTQSDQKGICPGGNAPDVLIGDKRESLTGEVGEPSSLQTHVTVNLHQDSTGHLQDVLPTWNWSFSGKEDLQARPIQLTLQETSPDDDLQ